LHTLLASTRPALTLVFKGFCHAQRKSTAHRLPCVTLEEGWHINGDFIPGGTSIAISAYLARRDENIFPGRREVQAREVAAE
jgi:hypothetical protein